MIFRSLSCKRRRGDRQRRNRRARQKLCFHSDVPLCADHSRQTNPLSKLIESVPAIVIQIQSAGMYSLKDKPKDKAPEIPLSELRRRFSGVFAVATRPCRRSSLEDSWSSQCHYHVRFAPIVLKKSDCERKLS